MATDQNLTQYKRTSKDIDSVVLGINGPIDSPGKIVSITWENFQQLKPDWLASDDLAYELKLFVMDVCDSKDIADMGFVLIRLSDLVRSATKLAENRPDLLREYLRLAAVLKASMLCGLIDSEAELFFKENLLLALEVSDFDLIDPIKELFSLAKGFPDRIEDQRQRFIHQIDENLEFLGTETMEMGGFEGERSPSVRNWIKDYIQFSSIYSLPSSTGLSKRGALERAAYMIQSKNVKKLSNDERSILLRLLELYDWLRFEVTKSDNTQTKIKVPHGQNIEAFKKKLQEQTVKMNERPSTPSPLNPHPQGERNKQVDLAKEIQREVKTPELPAEPEEKELPASTPPIEKEVNKTPVVSAVDKNVIALENLAKISRQPAEPFLEPPIPAFKEPIKPFRETPIQPFREPVHSFREEFDSQNIRPSELNNLEDLKKIGLPYLRQGSLQTQISNLKYQISDLAKANKVFPFVAVMAFEQSPLFKSYLAHGSSKVIGSGDAGEMSQEEFEAMADLRKEIERL